MSELRRISGRSDRVVVREPPKSEGIPFADKSKKGRGPSPVQAFRFILAMAGTLSCAYLLFTSFIAPPTEVVLANKLDRNGKPIGKEAALKGGRGLDGEALSDAAANTVAAGADLMRKAGRGEKIDGDRGLKPILSFNAKGGTPTDMMTQNGGGGLNINALAPPRDKAGEKESGAASSNPGLKKIAAAGGNAMPQSAFATGKPAPPPAPKAEPASLAAAPATKPEPAEPAPPAIREVTASAPRPSAPAQAVRPAPKPAADPREEAQLKAEIRAVEDADATTLSGAIEAAQRDFRVTPRVEGLVKQFTAAYPAHPRRSLFEQQIASLAQRRNVAVSERVSVSRPGELDAPRLEPKLATPVAECLTRIGGLRMAAIARKSVSAQPETPAYVIAIRASGQETLGEAREQLVAETERCLGGLYETATVTVFSADYPGERAAVSLIEGTREARIFLR